MTRAPVIRSLTDQPPCLPPLGRALEPSRLLDGVGAQIDVADEVGVGRVGSKSIHRLAVADEDGLARLLAGHLATLPDGGWRRRRSGKLRATPIESTMADRPDEPGKVIRRSGTVPTGDGSLLDSA